tara:strand:+ start:5056 stop:6099 length:1044 start_codon:yes stop_codon:yes gene_type:complete
MKIAIVGGGIFGVASALVLAKNHDVHIFEKNSDLLIGASGANQYRVHRGYHYPRSPETVDGIISSEDSFKEMFSESILTNFEHFYCIAKENSLTTAEEFLSFCKRFNLEYEQAELDIIDKNKINLCLKVKESVYDPDRLRKICINKLKEMSVNVHLESNFRLTDFENFDRVINCTYSNLNTLLEHIPSSQQEYQFELCEKPVVKLPDSFKEKSVVVMDGPFMCIDPLGNSGFHVLCNVVHEIHKTNIGKFPDIDDRYLDLVDQGIVKNPQITNFQEFISTAKEFFPEISSAKHIGSMFTYRAVPPRVEKTDERPTIVKEVDSKVINIFSGKITTCVEAAKVVEKIIE